MRRYDEALAAFEKWPERNPDSPYPYVVLAYTYGEINRLAEARAAAAQVLKRDPKFTITSNRGIFFYQNPAETKRIVDALRKAGLPE